VVDHRRHDHIGCRYALRHIQGRRSRYAHSAGDGNVGRGLRRHEDGQRDREHRLLRRPAVPSGHRLEHEQREPDVVGRGPGRELRDPPQHR
jgi:hypothetical protein